MQHVLSRTMHACRPPKYDRLLLDWDEYCKGMCEVWKGLQYAARLYMAQRAQERAKKSD